MQLFEKLLGMFSGAKEKLPENLNSVEDIKQKAAEMMEQHADTIDKVTQAIPGEADDQLVNKAKENNK